MPAFGDDREMFGAIRDRAFLAVSPERLGHVNLYLDQRVLRAGEQLGPAFQDLRAPRPSVLVFADDEPRPTSATPAATCSSTPNPASCTPSCRPGSRPGAPGSPTRSTPST